MDINLLKAEIKKAIEDGVYTDCITGDEGDEISFDALDSEVSTNNVIQVLIKYNLLTLNNKE